MNLFAASSWLVGLVVILQACAANPFVPLPSPQALPLFQRPFNGFFPATSMFDHDLPLPGDNNGYVLTFRGARIHIGQDGHDGYDWYMPVGVSVMAAADGEVIMAGLSAPFYCRLLGREVADQIQVEIRHEAPGGEVFVSGYAHLDRTNVQVGQRVSAGQIIGLSGNTGCSTGPHLHFQVDRLTNTNSGQPARIDPFGWQGTGQDPWAVHPRGAPSLRLWKDGQAPSTAPL